MNNKYRIRNISLNGKLKKFSLELPTEHEELFQWKKKKNKAETNNGIIEQQ